MNGFRDLGDLAGPSEKRVEAIRVVGEAGARAERPAVVETEQTQAHSEAEQNELEQLGEADVIPVLHCLFVLFEGDGPDPTRPENG